MSIVDSKDFEIKGAVSDMGKDASRMLANNGDGLIAQCTTGGASTTVNLLPAASGGLGYDAIVRKWLRPGMLIDIGTTGDSDTIATAATIERVVKSATAPQIIIDASVTTRPRTTSRSPTRTRRRRRTRSSAGCATCSVPRRRSSAAYNPATAGNEYWAPAVVDATTTSISIDLLLSLELAAWQEADSSEMPTWLFSGKQFNAFYSLLQNQVRFAGENGMGAGGIKGMKGLTFGGVGISVIPDVYDADWFHIQPEDLVMIRGSIKVPTWVSDLEGAGGDIRWVQNSTSFQNAVVWPFQIGALRRNRMAAAKSLTA